MWEKEYKKKEFYWGLNPLPILKKFLPKVKKGKALDIGAGEGRNSFFLAKNGFDVEAIDKVSEGLKKIKEFSKENNLKIKTKKTDAIDFYYKKEKYSLIVAFSVLDFMKKTQIERIINEIKISLEPGGFVFLGVFSVKDDMFARIKEAEIKEIEENTFFLKKTGTIRHFFTKKELKTAFKEFKIIYLNQKKIEDKSHGNPHFHNVIDFIARKKRK